MKIDTKNDIIIPAWKLIENDKKIKKFYFLPWILSIIFLSVLLVYQTIYTYTKITHTEDQTIQTILNFIHSAYITEFIIIAIIFIISYLLILPIFEWALVRYIAKKDTTRSANIWESLSIWLYKFLPIFEYNNIFSEFKLLSVLNWYLFILRFFDFKHINIISYIFIWIFIFSIIINILFSYSKFIIILENKKIFESIWKSTKIALLNLKNTFKIYFLMFILNIRVLLNFIVFLIFPFIVIFVIWFITTKLLQTLAIIILISIFILFILFLWYITWVLESLKMSIWYFAYKKWNERLQSIENELKDNTK